jgi:type II secretory pathway pseudopilin PulG
MELMIGMAITSVIAAAVGMMMFSTVQGSNVNDSQRQSLVIQQRATQMVSGIIRTSRQVLASGAGYVVLWTGDKQANGVPSLSDLVRIEWSSSAQTLTIYRSPSSIQGTGSDTAYPLGSTNFDTTTSGLKGTTNFPGTLVADGVTGWSLSYNVTPATSATMIYYQLTLTAGGAATTTLGTAAMRSQ